MTHLFSASWRSQQESQKNLFFWHSISLALNCLKHAVTLEFCSISIDKSRKDSSRDETVSQVRHLVSEVRVPAKRRCTRVVEGEGKEEEGKREQHQHQQIQDMESGYYEHYGSVH